MRKASLTHLCPSTFGHAERGQRPRGESSQPDPPLAPFYPYSHGYPFLHGNPLIGQGQAVYSPLWSSGGAHSIVVLRKRSLHCGPQEALATF